jgi:cytochrome c nitrite reductase small subunit
MQAKNPIQTIPGRRWFLSLGIPVLVPALAPAQEKTLAFQIDPVDYWGSRFLATVILIGIAVVLYSLVRYRGQASGPFAWGLLIVGVGLVPAASSALGTVLVLERSEKVQFCESCHLTMQRYVDDLRDSKSHSLAAVHFQNRYIPDDQCYECHTSYGIFGTVEAKKEGIIDVYRYYTRTFKVPVKLRHPYPNNDCLKCHAGAVKWLAQHGDFKDQIFSGELPCMSCHADKNPPHTLKY